MNTEVTLEILKSLRDHANGEDVKLPQPGMVQKAIETCIEWGEGLQRTSAASVKIAVACSATELEKEIRYHTRAIDYLSGDVISIQYQVCDREQEHHPAYSAMIHYKV